MKELILLALLFVQQTKPDEILQSEFCYRKNTNNEETSKGCAKTEQPEAISQSNTKRRSDDLIPEGVLPILIWWTEHIFPHDKTTKSLPIQCPLGSCITSYDRTLKTDRATRIIVFYGTEFRADDLPLPREPHEEWAIWHEESPKNNWILSHPEAISLFNHTATFRRESDYPLSTHYIEDIREWQKPVRYTTQERNRFQREFGFAPVVYLQRDCHPPSDRDNYIQELMKYIPIDSYGTCLNNKQIPSEIDGFHKLHSSQYHEFLSQYKFNLAFENAICDDYMTEKLFRPINIGSVPVYRGSPRAKDWAPNNRSIIMADDFAHPTDLAEFILYLNSNDTAYEEYLLYRQPGGITNEFLLEALKTRPWKILGDWDKSNFGHRMYAGFECYLCDKMHERNSKLAKYKADPELNSPPRNLQAKQIHLGCPEPRPWVNKKGWYQTFREGKLEAQALRRMIEAGETDSSLFYSKYLKERTDKYPS